MANTIGMTNERGMGVRGRGWKEGSTKTRLTRLASPPKKKDQGSLSGEVCFALLCRVVSKQTCIQLAYQHRNRYCLSDHGEV